MPKAVEKEIVDLSAVAQVDMTSEEYRALCEEIDAIVVEENKNTAYDLIRKHHKVGCEIHEYLEKHPEAGTEKFILSLKRTTKYSRVFLYDSLGMRRLTGDMPLDEWMVSRYGDRPVAWTILRNEIRGVKNPAEKKEETPDTLATKILKKYGTDFVKKVVSALEKLL